MLQVYNSLTKNIERFEPEESRVIMYVCGLTPYDHAHIGHGRTYVSFDIIKRYLISKGYSVYHIQNITDVDDKILKRAKERKEKPAELTKKYHEEAMRLFEKLNILKADVYPTVTGHIKEIIDTIQKIEKNGYCYDTESGVYFDVQKFKDYGKLSGQKMDEIKSGARVEIDETKRNPEDFALWKKTNGEIVEFDSPWGRGRPGWHIECSAMSWKYAGRTIDIHGGARDLIFPHHENEIAQSEAAFKKKFVKYWLHTGFLTVEGEKMSKSLGNFITLADMLAMYDANAVRLWFALAHYRSPLDFSLEETVESREGPIGEVKEIKSAEESVKRIFNSMRMLKEALEKSKPETKDVHFREETASQLEEFYKHMDNDFDTPNSLAVFFNIIREINIHLDGEALDYEWLGKLKGEIEKILWIFGLKQEEKKIEGLSMALINILIELREEARKEKNFRLSDRIRARLKEHGIIIEDTEKGIRWYIE